MSDIKTVQKRTTLNGGPAGRAGWRAVLPNEKHEFSMGWRAAQKGGMAGCTLSWPTEKGGPEGCPFLQPALPLSATRLTAFLCSPPARPSVFSAARQTAKSSPFSYGNTSLQPARPSN